MIQPRKRSCWPTQHGDHSAPAEAVAGPLTSRTGLSGASSEAPAGREDETDPKRDLLALWSASEGVVYNVWWSAMGSYQSSFRGEGATAPRNEEVAGCEVSVERPRG